MLSALISLFQKKQNPSRAEEQEIAEPVSKPVLPFVDISKFEFTDLERVAEEISQKYGFDGDLLKIYSENKGVLVHKWHHYLPLYDRYFSRFRGSTFRFLEIGVSKGGSLNMWRKYFGDDAIIYGIDIDPDCAKYDGMSGQVRIGSQDDEAFLNSVVEEMGGVDVVLDDGSHQMDHIKSSLNTLFPKVSNGGIYMIEDLATAYWPYFGGGYDSENNFFAMISEIVNDMHHWYHEEDIHHPEVSGSCSGISVHDSMVILEKSIVHPPRHSQVV